MIERLKMSSLLLFLSFSFAMTENVITVIIFCAKSRDWLWTNTWTEG